MHCIAFTCKEWKPNSLGRYGKNSSASKTCFVAAMFAHMLRLIECFHSRGQHLCKFIETKESVCIRKEFNSHRSGLGHQHGRRFIVLGHQYGRRDVMWKHSIIEIRFHLLLKYFSIRNSLVMFRLLRCLLMPSPSLLLAPLNFKSAFSLQRIFRCQIFPCEDWQFGVLVFAVLFAWEMAWDSSIVNIVLQTMKRQLFMNTLVIDGKSKSLSVECCLETNMRRDVN